MLWHCYRFSAIPSNSDDDFATRKNRSLLKSDSSLPSGATRAYSRNWYGSATAWSPSGTSGKAHASGSGRSSEKLRIHEELRYRSCFEERWKGKSCRVGGGPLPGTNARPPDGPRTFVCAGGPSHASGSRKKTTHNAEALALSSSYLCPRFASKCPLLLTTLLFFWPAC